MNDLVQFLTACLDEDERIARAATPGPWSDQGGYVTDVGPDGLPRVQVTDYGTQDGEPEEDNPQGRADSAHIAVWDPARVLREIDAKRQIIRLHEITVEKTRVTPFDPYTGERNPDEYDVTCAICGWVSDDRTSACLTLRLLALPYADRPGYREEWRP